MQHNRRIVWQVGGLLGAFVLTIVSSIALPQSGLAGSTWISQQISWGDIWSSLRRIRTGKGGKGELCLLVPADAKEPEVIWHDRPLFVWKGLEQTIGLRQAESKTVFWRRSLSQPGTIVNQVQYTGQALQPGQTYELLLFSSPMAVDPIRWQAFTIMATRDRATITSELQQLTTLLKQKRYSDETIAQQRAQYFALHQLSSDVLQEIYAVKNPSIALRQKTQEIATEICNPPR